MKDWLEASSKLALEVKRCEKKYAPSVNDEGYRDYLACAKTREQVTQKKFKQIGHFQAALDNIRSSLRNLENDKMDCLYFQNLLEGFESKLSAFKAGMAKEYEELVQLELHLDTDITTLESHIEHVMTKNSHGIPTTKSRKSVDEDIKCRNDKISAHKAEIGAIERKISSLGDRFGGWDPRDHDIFIRVWTQCVGPVTGASNTNHKRTDNVSKLHEKEMKNSTDTNSVLDLGSKSAYVLRRRLVQAVQMKSEEEIEDHLLWFVEVEMLQRRKREILSVWKQEKEREKPDLQFPSSASPLESQSPAKTAMSDRKRELDRQKLERWRKEKEEKKAQEQLRERRRQEEEKKAKEREKAERQQNNRVLVQNWIEERKVKEQVAASAKGDDSKSSADLASLRRKQKEEIEKAKARRNKINRQRAASTGRLQRQKDLAETAIDPELKSRVKSKLHEPTKVYMSNRLTAEDLEMRERKRQSGGAHDAKIVCGGYDLKFTGRAIPSWTRGVM